MWLDFVQACVEMKTQWTMYIVISYDMLPFTTFLSKYLQKYIIICCFQVTFPSIVHVLNTHLVLIYQQQGVGIAQWLEHWTCDWKVVVSNPCWSSGIIFSLQGWLSVLTHFGIRSTPMLPQQHIKNPGHSAKSAGGRLQLNTHTPYICGFAWSHMVHGCMVYTELALRRLQFHVAPAMPVL